MYSACLRGLACVFVADSSGRPTGGFRVRQRHQRAQSGRQVRAVASRQRGNARSRLSSQPVSVAMMQEHTPARIGIRVN